MKNNTQLTVANTELVVGPKVTVELREHQIIAGAKQMTLSVDDKVVVSIVGGGFGLYGDGVSTFEMWDYREDEPQGYLSVDEINQHLQDNPL